MTTPDTTEVSRTKPLRIVHDSVTEQRRLPAPPLQVMEAFGDIERRKRWFRVPGEERRSPDFRIGGGETITAKTAVSGTTESIEYTSTFLDLVDGECIVFAYRSRIDGHMHAVALVTVTLADGGDGTTSITYTDQHSLYVYPGDEEAITTAHHQGALRLMLNGLAAELRA